MAVILVGIVTTQTSYIFKQACRQASGQVGGLAGSQKKGWAADLVFTQNNLY
jgi:hypothetical protein